MRRIVRIGLTLILGILWVVSACGQTPLEIHGQVDVIAKNTAGRDATNTAPYGSSNFHALRVRLFLEKSVSDKVEVFTQFFSDNARSPIIYSAYVRVKSGRPWANAEVGLIRNPFGAWGPRSYSDKNPLISVPLGYNYQTSLLFEDLQRSSVELLAHRGQGSEGEEEDKGLPFISDATWNTGVFFYGGNSQLEYTAGLLSGSLAYPTTEPEKGRPQAAGRASYTPVMGLTLGTSFAYGPYLEKGHQSQLPAGAKVTQYNQRLFSMDASFERGHFTGHSEIIFNRWTHPFISEPLDAYAWYLDGSYKFLTRFFFATRYDRMEFSRIADPNGGRSAWDFPLYRVETGIGYKIDRNVTFKVVGQLTRYPGQRSFNDEIWATQLSANL